MSRSGAKLEGPGASLPRAHLPLSHSEPASHGHSASAHSLWRVILTPVLLVGPAPLTGLCMGAVQAKPIGISLLESLMLFPDEGIRASFPLDLTLPRESSSGATGDPAEP